MKNYSKKIILVFLAAILFMMPVIAVETPSANENTVRKFTPVIDGVIDEEYLSSCRLSYKWDESDRELCSGTGGFGFFARDEDGNIIRDEDGLPVEGDDTLYSFDCELDAYFLWDDEYLYIALNITDDDCACLSDEAWERAKNPATNEYVPIYNDCVSFSLKKGELNNTVTAEREGRIVALDDFYNEGELCDVAGWWNGGESDPRRVLTVKETDCGYTMEFCIPIVAKEKETILCDGGQISCLITVTDSSPDSGLTYGHYRYTEDEPDDRDKDLAYVDSMILIVPEVTLILSDEPIVLPPYDLTGDGVFDAGDLTRLMRVLAGDGAATVAQSADINSDGKVNTKDLTRMMKYLAEGNE